MEKKLSRRVPDEKAASQDEIQAAINSLTSAELLRLKGFAHFKIRGLRQASQGRDWEDLLQEACTATLSGDRRWNKSVSFERYLIDAMRSISYAWRKKFERDEVSFVPEMRQTAGGEEQSILLSIPSTVPGVERVSISKQELESIEQLFNKDPLVLEIIGGLRSEMTGPEIQEALGITQTDYETALRRMRRTIQAAASKNGSGI